MQENTPTLHTDRLILRRFALHDDKALFALLRDEEVNRFLPWLPFESLGQACLQPFYLDSRDFGYALRRECWGRGIIPEAWQEKGARRL